MGGSSLAFRESLSFGQAGESAISRWFQSKGYAVLPVYEKLLDTGKGPQLFMPHDRQLIAPDIFVFNGSKAFWIEAKHKTAFSKHRHTNRWVTGIDLRHYEDYLIVNSTTPWPVWLLFVQRGGQAKDSPADSPAGLYGNTLDYLSAHENHRHENWGKSGMVYWAIEHLKFIASLEEVLDTEVKQAEWWES
jgi:hypothetical protein